MGIDHARHDKRRVSIIGAGQCDEALYALAMDLGRALAKAGFTTVCGGREGVMRGVCEGAKAEGGLTIGILPGLERDHANPFVDIVIATGLGHMRNFLVILNGDVVVAVEGGAGTLSEIGLALKSGKTVIALGRWKHLELPGLIPAKDVPEAMARVREALNS